MPKGLVKILDLLAAFAIVGPLSAFLLGSLRAADGDTATTPLSASNPARGALYLVVCFVLVGAVGLFSGRLVTRGRGICMVGLALMWAASATANVRQLFGDADSASTLTPLLLESLLLIPLVLATTLLIEALSPVASDEQGIPFGPSLPPPGFSGVRSSFVPGQFFASLAAAVVAAGLVGWLVAINSTKGQAIFAAFLGGIAAGCASAAAARSTGRPASLIPAAVALPLVAALTLLYLKFSSGGSLAPQTRAIASELPNQLFALGRILPLDWVAGGLFGVPVGATWAAAMVERPKDADAEPAHA